MTNRDRALPYLLETELIAFDELRHKLPGIEKPERREVFIRQIVDSIRRIEFISVIDLREISAARADPFSDYFDPIRAAIFSKRNGKLDEAFWLTFIAIHFGKSADTGWRLARDIYGGIYGSTIWSWENICCNPNNFRQWLTDSYDILKGDGIWRKFGNHRKYQSLKPTATQSPDRVFESYINWVGPTHSHENLIQDATNKVGTNPRILFDHLYNEMNCVVSFGRTGKFDYLTMIAKLGLADVEPGSTYMSESTGPVLGARLLFGGKMNSNISFSNLEEKLADLESNLSVGPMGMQVLEDSLCNWQKSPSRYVYFNG